MIVKLADNIVSPLGFTTADNYRAVVEGRSALRRYEGLWGLPEPCVASLVERDAVEAAFCALGGKGCDFTFFERMAAVSIGGALAQAAIAPGSDRVVFLLSTTKGNVHLLADAASADADALCLGVSARRIARFFGNANTPVVVSNACTSGVCAQIAALRLLDSGRYDYAVVTGVDVQSPFIVSGFQSFKALSDEPCRPFDARRRGLNLGEAAATVVYASDRVASSAAAVWTAVRGAIRNDANHISGPSRTGEGSYQALQAVLADTDVSRLAVVSVHGTATCYNDEMEAVALSRAGLSPVPVSGLKGCFGHTMGAAGVLESILTMYALDNNTILATKGYDTPGTTCPPNVCNQHRRTDKTAFVKLLSGFGGCNAALLFDKQPVPMMPGAALVHPSAPLKKRATVCLTHEGATANGTRVVTQARGSALLAELYHAVVGDYPKYFKMDPLCRVGFVASELLLRQPHDAFDPATCGVVFVGRSGSLADDRRYQATIASPDNFFPSPSLFVYTLPNIVTGEIAIRNHFHGETNSILLDHYDAALVEALLQTVAADSGLATLVGGWVDCADDDHFQAFVSLYMREV